MRTWLVQYRAGGAAAVASGHNRVGNVHVCVTVADVEAKHRQVSDLGLEPTVLVEVAGGRSRSFYVDDPDGTPIEFTQRISS